MKTRLVIYSHILQLRSEPFVALKNANGGMRYAVLLYAVVTLIAGAGSWLGLPATLQRPLLTERVDAVAGWVERFDRDVTPQLISSLHKVEREELSQLQADKIQKMALSIAGISGGLAFNRSSFDDALFELAADEGLTRLVIPLGLSEEQIGQTRVFLHELIDDSNEALSGFRILIETVQPPLGTRFSRFTIMVGAWISTPFAIMAQWLPLGFVLLLTMKALGGAATLRQHIVGLLLTGAPLLLLFFTFVPNLEPALPSVYNSACGLFGRILAIIGVSWSALILLKAMSVMHGVSMWRVLAAMALTALLLFVVIRIATAGAVAFVVFG